MRRKNACAHVAVATCNFEFRLPPQNFFLGLARSWRWKREGGHADDCIGCEWRRKKAERGSERGLWPHWDHLNSRKAAAIYCPSVIMLPPSAVSLPFPVRSQAHSHQGRLAFPPASVGSARIRPSIPSALTPPKKEIVFHTIRSRWDSKCTA